MALRHIVLASLSISIWQVEASCSGIHHNCSQICTRFGEAFICSCFRGYKLARDGLSCLDVDECTEYRPCHQLCMNTYGNYICACRDGFTLDTNSSECKDKDECLNPSACLIDGIKRVCINLPGTFQCLEEIYAEDKSILFDRELLKIPEEEHTDATTSRTPPSSTTTSPLTATSPPPKCPEKDGGPEKGYNIGSAITSYQLNVIAGCFITAVGLIVVFVIVFIVVQWRRRRHMDASCLPESARSASPTSISSLTGSPQYQWRRNYSRRPDRGSPRRWRPYVRTDRSRDGGKTTTRSRTSDKDDDVNKMARLEKINESFKEDDNNNNPVPAFV